MQRRTTFSEGGVLRTAFDISVVIRHLKPEMQVERAVRSCVSQTLPGYSVQIIVLGTASCIQAAPLTAGFANFAQTLVCPENHSELDLTVFGVEHAQGRLVMILDGDDFISDYTLLSQQIFLFDHPECQGVYSDYWAVEPGFDKKTCRQTPTAAKFLSGMMWRRDALVRALRHDSTSSTSALELSLKGCQVGHLPIAFLRHTEPTTNQNN